MLIKVPTRRTDTKINKRRTKPQEEDHLYPFPQSCRGSGSAKPCTHEGRTQPITPESGQDAMCCATQRKVRLTRGPCSPDAVQCTYSDCVRPSMTRRSPWSNAIREGTSPCPRRRTLKSTELPKLILTMSLGAFCGPNKGSLSLCQRINELGPEYQFKFTPVGNSLLPHQGDKRGATLPHKPITPRQMASLVCGLIAAPCPYWYEHRQSCPGVTQAVSYVPCFLHPTRR